MSEAQCDNSNSNNTIFGIPVIVLVVFLLDDYSMLMLDDYALNNNVEQLAKPTTICSTKELPIKLTATVNTLECEKRG